jgi:hypothetical protein
MCIALSTKKSCKMLNKRFQKKIESYKNQLEQNAIEAKAQKAIQVSLKQELAKMDEKLGKVHNVVQEKDSEIDGLKMNMKQLQRSENDLKVDTKMKEAEIVQLTAEIFNMVKDLGFAKYMNVKIESLQSDLNQTMEKLQHAEQIISSKTKTLEKAIIDSETIVKENHINLAKTEDDLKVKNAEIDSLKIDVQYAFKTHAMEAKTQKAMEVTLKQDLAKTYEKLVMFHNVIQEKDSEIDGLKINFDQLQHSENNLKVDTKIKEAEIFHLKANIDKLIKDLDIAKTMVVFEDHHECKCDVKGAINETLKKEVENMKKTLELRVAGMDLLRKEITIRNDEIKLCRREMEQLKEQMGH